MEQPRVEEDALNYDVQLSKDLTELEQDPRFKRVFEEKFIEAFAVTNVFTIASMDQAARLRSHEKTIARSHYCQFMLQIHEAGLFAKEALLESQDGDESEETDY